jgi:signal transduction histidine kinase
VGVRRPRQRRLPPPLRLDQLYAIDDRPQTPREWERWLASTRNTTTIVAHGGADAPRSTNGAGLGLAVARAIVDAHGGQIWLPATRTGTRVRFSVPIAA